MKPVTPSLANLFSTGHPLSLVGWQLVRTRDPFVDPRGAYPGLVQRVYTRPDGERTASVGVFSWRNRLVYLAWGYADEPHCSFHAVISPQQVVGEIQSGCPDMKAITDDSGLIVDIQLSGTRVCDPEIV
jgi:hypothetical protein